MTALQAPSQPALHQPDTHQLDTHQPDAHQADAPQSETHQPDTQKQNARQTGMASAHVHPDMRLHADLSERVVVQSHTLAWQASPAPLVQRRLLERVGGEVARATSVVRYAPGAKFSTHLHELGEEIFVLDGTLSDESGDYGPGTYLKNPPGSSHAPYSEQGCTLFVKLRHLDPDDRERVVVNTRQAPWFQGLVSGLTVLPLSEFGTQHTAMVRWAPGTYFNPHRHYGGEEIFVVDGVFSDEHGSYPQGSWLRSPHLSQHQPFSVEGCLILVKTGHLLQNTPSV